MVVAYLAEFTLYFLRSGLGALYHHAPRLLTSASWGWPVGAGVRPAGGCVQHFQNFPRSRGEALYD